MKRILVSFLGWVVVLSPVFGNAETKKVQITKVWETESLFKQPESVAYDSKRNILYVSNVNGKPDEKNGKGFISKVALDGNAVKIKWVIGLNAPKGLEVLGDRLFAGDINELVEIDIKTGKVVDRYKAEGSKFINDVVADNEGRIYVSDMMGNAIYRLEKGKLLRWLDTDALDFPNGLCVNDDELFIASWGSEQPGAILLVKIKTKDIKPHNGLKLGKLDGIEADVSGGFFTSDWVSGTLAYTSNNGKVHVLEKLEQGAADLEYIKAKKQLIIPLMNSGKLVAYDVL